MIRNPLVKPFAKPLAKPFAKPLAKLLVKPLAKPLANRQTQADPSQNGAISPSAAVTASKA